MKTQISCLEQKVNLQNDAISKARDLKVNFDKMLEELHNTKIELDEVTLRRDKISNDFNLAQLELQRTEEELTQTRHSHQ